MSNEDGAKMNGGLSVVEIARQELGEDFDFKQNGNPGEFEPEEGLQNITDEEFKEYFKLRDEIQEQRDVLSDRLALGKAVLVGRGADSAGLNSAYGRWKTDEHKRKKFDQTYMRVTKLMGVQHQEDLPLFDEESEGED